MDNAANPYWIGIDCTLWSQGCWFLRNNIIIKVLSVLPTASFSPQAYNLKRSFQAKHIISTQAIIYMKPYRCVFSTCTHVDEQQQIPHSHFTEWHHSTSASSSSSHISALLIFWLPSLALDFVSGVRWGYTHHLQHLTAQRWRYLLRFSLLLLSSFQFPLAHFQ